MAKATGIRICILALSIASLAYSTWAGPVPGAAAGQGTPPPAGVTSRDAGGGMYDVTFCWIPGSKVENAGVAGSFNGWSRTATPMTGPDARGAYTVTVQLAGGEYEYKYVSGSNDWFADPANTDKRSNDKGSDNSMLRLGVFAELPKIEAHRGDGKIEARLLYHAPDSFTYYEALSPSEALVRMRALRGDVENAYVILKSGANVMREEPMTFVTSDERFDYYEYHYAADSAKGKKSGAAGPDSYSFAVADGGARGRMDQTFAFDFSASRRVETPAWARRAVWYQIMIDRFRNGDLQNDPECTPGTGRVARTSKWTGDVYAIQPWEKDGDKTILQVDGDHSTTADIYERLYGGDFKGVEEKLGYLKELGVNAIYFNPVFEATSAHKYNGKSYTHADDGYGTPGEFAKSVAREDFFNAATWEFNDSDKKFLKMVRKAKSRGMHVIIDGVFNHLGQDAVPFLDLVKNKRQSRFAGWYQVDSWEPFKASGWAGFGGLPQFRKDPQNGLTDPTLREYLFAVTRRWLDPNGDGDPSDGIDGWRLDVPFEIPKPFWAEWRKVVKSVNPEAYIVGEVWDPAEQWLDGKTFDAVMNYQFRLACLKYFGNVQKRTSASAFDAELARLRIRYPRGCTYVLQNLYDSHDTDRLASRLINPDLDGDAHYDGRNRIQDNGPNYAIAPPTDAAYQRQKMMALFQMMYVGAPMIYYGDEVGMYGPDDPFNRNPMWWKDLMPYDNPGDRIRPDLLKEYKALCRLRTENPVLSDGEFTTLLADDAHDVYAFVRWSGAEKKAFVAVFNNSDSERTVTLKSPRAPALPAGFSHAKLIHGETAVKIGMGGTSKDAQTLEITLPAVSGAAIRVNRK